MCNYDAPCAGARIETIVFSTLQVLVAMPPVRGRELKQRRSIAKSWILSDAPCAGARIETFGYPNT